MSCPLCTSRTIKRLSIFAALLALLGIGIWWAFFDTYHFAVVQDGVLYRDGVRTNRELAATYRKSHFKTVVNLISDSEFAKPEFQSEVELCRGRGVEMIRIPIALGAQPTDA